jgi:hypothetical protein
MSKAQPIDVRDMAIVHRTFRKAYDEAARLVRAVPTPSPGRVTFLADHIDLALAALHIHHEDEDALLAVLTAEAETPLERRLSQVIMRGGLGQKPKPAKVRAGTTIMAEGEAADNIVLVLDGMVQVEVGGAALAELGPGAVLGERASLEQGRRTATVRALTDCRIVSYLAADLSANDLTELVPGHHREDLANP